MMLVQTATAAHRAVQLVRALDTKLSAILPQSDRVAVDSREGLAWAGLVDAVAQCTLKADELIALSSPVIGTHRASGSGDG